MVRVYIRGGCAVLCMCIGVAVHVYRGGCESSSFPPVSLRELMATEAQAAAARSQIER